MISLISSLQQIQLCGWRTLTARMHDAWKQRQEFEAPPLASLDASIARLPPYSRGPNIASNEEMMGCKFCSQCNISPDLKDII